MPTFLLGDLGANPLFDGFSASESEPVVTEFKGLYHPMISLLVAPESPLVLASADDDIEVLFTCTADDEDGETVDWTAEPYEVATLTFYVVSINETQSLANAVISHTIAAEDRTPGSASLQFRYVFDETDLALLTGIIYYAYAQVTLSNGERRTFGRVEINRNG